MGGYSYKQTGIGTSASFSIPMNWINAIPNSTSGTATVKVQTKNGSANIGSAVSKTFTITVPASVVPSFNFGVSRVDGAVPASWGIYLKGKSKATATISGAAGSYSSTIKSYSISGGGSSTTGTSMTTGFLNSAGTVTFTAKVSDSRGRTTTKTASITVIDYFAPYVSGASVYRCNSAGTADSNGTYFRAAATAKYASCNGKNGYTLRVRYKKPTDSAWSGYTNISSGSYVIVSGLSTEYSYDVEISIGDYFTGAIWRSSIPTAAYTMHFKKGGKGVAFGKASERDNAVESAWPIYINGIANWNIAQPTILGTGTDLNKTRMPGFYAIGSNDTAQGISNLPFQEAAFIAVVPYSLGSDPMISQIAISYNAQKFAIRSYYNWDPIRWTGWYIYKPST